MVNATTETGVNRLTYSNSPAVNVYGGVLKMTNAPAALAYSQTMGQLTAYNGLSVGSSVTNIGFTNDMAASGSPMMTFQNGGNTTFVHSGGASTVNFFSPAGLDNTNNIIHITSSINTTPAGQIMGVGHDGHGHQRPHGLCRRQQWQERRPGKHPRLRPVNLSSSSGAYTLGDNYSLAINSSTTIAALRYTGTGNTLALNAGLATNGILNAGTGMLIIGGPSSLSLTSTSTPLFLTTAMGANTVITARSSTATMPT